MLSNSVCSLLSTSSPVSLGFGVAGATCSMPALEGGSAAAADPSVEVDTRWRGRWRGCHQLGGGGRRLCRRQGGRVDGDSIGGRRCKRGWCGDQRDWARVWRTLDRRNRGGMGGRWRQASNVCPDIRRPSASSGVLFIDKYLYNLVTLLAHIPIKYLK